MQGQLGAFLLEVHAVDLTLSNPMYRTRHSTGELDGNLLGPLLLLNYSAIMSFVFGVFRVIRMGFLLSFVLRVCP